MNQVLNGYRKILPFFFARMNRQTHPLLPLLEGKKAYQLHISRPFQRGWDPQPCLCASVLLLETPPHAWRRGSCLPFRALRRRLIPQQKLPLPYPLEVPRILAEPQCLRIRWKFMRRKLFWCLQKYNIPDKNLASDNRLTRYICSRFLFPGIRAAKALPFRCSLWRRCTRWQAWFKIFISQTSESDMTYHALCWVRSRALPFAERGRGGAARLISTIRWAPTQCQEAYYSRGMRSGLVPRMRCIFLLSSWQITPYLNLHFYTIRNRITIVCVSVCVIKEPYKTFYMVLGT